MHTYEILASIRRAISEIWKSTLNSMFWMNLQQEETIGCGAKIMSAIFMMPIAVEPPAWLRRATSINICSSMVMARAPNGAADFISELERGHKSGIRANGNILPPLYFCPFFFLGSIGRPGSGSFKKELVKPRSWQGLEQICMPSRIKPLFKQ